MTFTGKAPERLHIGERIKAVRHSKHLSLRALSAKSGICANALSLIERNAVSPTATTLTAIAMAFDVRMCQFFRDKEEGNCRDKGEEECVVFRRDNDRENGATEVLASKLKGQRLSPVLVRLEPRHRVPDFCFHPGDEFVCCLSGLIQCEVEKERIVLIPGDAITYKGEMPHRIRNVAPVRSEALVVFEGGTRYVQYHTYSLTPNHALAHMPRTA